jgi:hypothetical protein
MFLRGKCNSSAGAPSLAVFFRQGWDSTNLHAHLCGIPPLNPTKGFKGTRISYCAAPSQRCVCGFLSRKAA